MVQHFRHTALIAEELTGPHIASLLAVRLIVDWMGSAYTLHRWSQDNRWRFRFAPLLRARY